MLLQIALDGPAGSGKSTVAKLVAKRLCCDYIDTGAMYRAITLKFIESGFFEQMELADPVLSPESEASIETVLDHTEISLYTDKVILDGKDVSDTIRSPEVTRRVSQVAAMSVVRRHLVGMQQQQAIGRNVVMDGRDIATVVLPHTHFKFFLTASLEERARRRFLEFETRGFSADLQTILEDIKHRDLVDSSREDSPMVMSEDSYEIDTTGKTIEDVVDTICLFVEKKVAEIEGEDLC